VASAVVFVYTSGWCLARLAQMNAPAVGGAMFVGPGAGIVVTGALASGLVQWGGHSQTGWLIFGMLAFALTALVWRIFQGPAVTAVSSANADHATIAAPVHGRAEVGCLALAYGLAGLGYIVTATFLPVIARGALPGSPWLDMFWPIFGFGVMVGALLATRLRVTLDMRALLVGCYLMQAAGIAIGVWSPSLMGFAAGSLLLGIPFTAITFFAMQEVRRLRPALPASFMGLLTAVWSLGQLAGPPMVALLLRTHSSTDAAFTVALEIAAGALLAGALLYVAMMRRWPRG